MSRRKAGWSDSLRPSSSNNKRFDMVGISMNSAPSINSAAPVLMAVLAHPDDESLGFGGTLAWYASRGFEVHLLTATRGEGGRFGEFRPGDAGHPGTSALGRIREAELRAAAAVLGIGGVALLDYLDQHLDRAEPREVVQAIAAHVRRIRPDVVL